MDSNIDLETSEAPKNASILALEKEGAIETVNELITGRLEILEDHSRFNRDSRMIAEGLENVLAELKMELSEEKLRAARIAAILHDIGKSGPAAATPEQSTSIVRVFSANLPFSRESSDRQIGSVIAEYFPGEAEQILTDLAALGIGPETRMQDFWNRHSDWTKDILDAQANTLPELVKVIAASHHIDRGINPYNLAPENIPAVARVIGISEEYLETLDSALMVVDKYQAAVARNNLSHAEAIKVVHAILDHKYKDNPVIGRIFDVLDRLGQEQRIFQASLDN